MKRTRSELPEPTTFFKKDDTLLKSSALKVNKDQGSSRACAAPGADLSKVCSTHTGGKGRPRLRTSRDILYGRYTDPPSELEYDEHDRAPREVLTQDAFHATLATFQKAEEFVCRVVACTYIGASNGALSSHINGMHTPFLDMGQCGELVARQNHLDYRSYLVRFNEIPKHMRDWMRLGLDWYNSDGCVSVIPWRNTRDKFVFSKRYLCSACRSVAWGKQTSVRHARRLCKGAKAVDKKKVLSDNNLKIERVDVESLAALQMRSGKNDDLTSRNPIYGHPDRILHARTLVDRVNLMAPYICLRSGCMLRFNEKESLAWHLQHSNCVSLGLLQTDISSDPLFVDDYHSDGDSTASDDASSEEQELNFDSFTLFASSVLAEERSCSLVLHMPKNLSALRISKDRQHQIKAQPAEKIVDYTDIAWKTLGRPRRHLSLTTRQQSLLKPGKHLPWSIALQYHWPEHAHRYMFSRGLSPVESHDAIVWSGDGYSAAVQGLSSRAQSFVQCFETDQWLLTYSEEDTSFFPSRRWPDEQISQLHFYLGHFFDIYVADVPEHVWEKCSKGVRKPGSAYCHQAKTMSTFFALYSVTQKRLYTPPLAFDCGTALCLYGKPWRYVKRKVVMDPLADDIRTMYDQIFLGIQ